MIPYILQVVAFQLVFLALYELLLKKETFFQWNRLYLCLTPLVALVLPLIRIQALQHAVPQEFISVLPEVILTNTTTEIASATTNSPFSTLQVIFSIGIIFSSFLFLWKLFRIQKLIQKGRKEIRNDVKLIHLPNSTGAFSFAGTVFLGEMLQESTKEYILKHELVHIRQKHYVDLLYFEILRILFWFNPLVYVYQNRVIALHEYIADAEVVSRTNKKSYYQNLLSEVFQTHTISFVNTFFNQSLIKKRIVMLHKSKSKKTRLLKFALVLPLLALFVAVSSCEQSQTNNSEYDNQKTTMGSEPNEERTQLNPKKPTPTVTIKRIETSETDDLGVPFVVVDSAPVYPGCEGLSNEERKQCLSEKINTLISENFDTKVARNTGLTGRQRITVQFKIDKEGHVMEVRSRAQAKALEEEATRVINLLPQMQPGIQDGKEVNVLYSLPIVFEVKEVKE